PRRAPAPPGGSRCRSRCERGEEELAVKRWDRLAQLNNEFHEAVARASGNSQLPFLLNLYAKRITWMFARSAERRGPVAWVEHAAIVEAVAGRDPDLAERRAREHIEHSRQEFLVEIGETPLDS
ncbi:MAG: FCD domain-containing protein, partial [Acidimicrobiales bacterium]